jgi:hypothetical protein
VSAFELADVTISIFEPPGSDRAGGGRSVRTVSQVPRVAVMVYRA